MSARRIIGWLIVVPACVMIAISAFTPETVDQIAGGAAGPADYAVVWIFVALIGAWVGRIGR
jgi:hypothetical protein